MSTTTSQCLPTSIPELASIVAVGPVSSRGPLPSLHDDPQKIHQLSQLLDMPPGTEVRVTTVAASMIVR